MTGMKHFTFVKPFHPRRLNYAASALFAAINFVLADDQANWPRWRGPRDNGSIENGNYPAKFEKILWKAPLPGKGCSTPVIWDQRIYLTAPMNGLDDLTGREPSTCKATPQPEFSPAASRTPEPLH